MKTPETTEEILSVALEIYEDAKSRDFDSLSPLLLIEGDCAWLNEGQCYCYNERDRERIISAILSQGLAAMMLDGYELVRREVPQEAHP